MILMDWFNSLILRTILKFKKNRERLDYIKFIHQEGVKEDTDDVNDYVYVASGADLPIFFKLAIEPTDYVKSQGYWGSCVSHAICSGMEIAYKLKGNKVPGDIPLSERYHYYWSRQEDYMNNYPENEGMYPRIGLKVANEIGTCPEKLCPYITADMNNKPDIFADGFRMWKIDTYFRLFDKDAIKECLYEFNQPVVVSLTLNKSFKSFTGDIDTEGSTSGAHEILIYGYNDSTNEFFCINSWGSGYKENGTMRIPYDYWDKFSYDTWTFSVK